MVEMPSMNDSWSNAIKVDKEIDFLTAQLKLKDKEIQNLNNTKEQLIAIVKKQEDIINQLLTLLHKECGK